MIAMVIWLFVLGLIVGSFIGALSWRLPRKVSIARGRSFCPNCRKKISFYDNIPVLSYLILGGKCRKCKSRISVRYPLIELATGIVFVLIGIDLSSIVIHFPWLLGVGILQLPILFILSSILITIIVTDLENQLIFDELVFAGLAVVLFTYILGDFGMIYSFLFSGFVISIFLLFVNFATKGKGMGFGDVKLALFVGSMLSFKDALFWIFVSFLMGAVLGIMLIVFGRAKLKDRIAFGPFMIVALGVILLFTMYYETFF